MAMFILLCSSLTNAEQLKPMPGTDIHDFAKVISADKKTQLQQMAKRLKDEFNTEIAVVTITTLNGEAPFDYSLKLAREWGIGSADNEVRGILILVALQERKTSFQTSRHIEGELPDGVTGEIGRQMEPDFKNGDFGGGLSKGLSLILDRLKEVYTPQAKPQPKTGNAKLWLWVLLGCATVSAMAFLLVGRSRKRAAEIERKRALTVAETRKNYFAAEQVSSRQTGQKSRQQKQERKEKKQRELSERQKELIKKQQEQQDKKNRKERNRSHRPSARNSPAYNASSNPYESGSSYSSNNDYSSNDYSSTYSYDSGSSSDSGSSPDAGSNYSGGSDFGGGGSESRW